MEISPISATFNNLKQSNSQPLNATSAKTFISALVVFKGSSHRQMILLITCWPLGSPIFCPLAPNFSSGVKVLKLFSFVTVDEAE